MQEFVAGQDRRRELQEALDLGRGLGRVKVLVLLTNGPMTLRDIAEANGVDAPYATVIVDKLVSRGLVERTAHPDDNRRKLVKLTAAGREAAALAERILAEPPAALVALAPADLNFLDEVLTRLVPAMANVKNAGWSHR
jgi:DNA-binding MarR family transcriptional regulator